MSDLVGNPEDRFSLVAAYINLKFSVRSHLRTGHFKPPRGKTNNVVSKQV